MSSRPFTESRWRLPLASLALAALAAGCASQPQPAAEPAAGKATEVPAAVRTQYEQAVAAMASGDAVEAELRFAEFLLSHPDYPGAHVNMAILKYDAGNLEAAGANLGKALELDPDHPVALNQLGMLKRRQGEFEAAEDAYLAAIAAAPEYALPHYNLGVLNELYFQRLEAALAHFERYRELSGADDEVDMWIADLERRIAANQRTANVTE